MKLRKRIKILIIISVLLGFVIFVYGSYQYWLASLEVPLKEIIPDSDLTIESPSLSRGEEIPEKIISDGEKVSEEEKESEKPLLQSPQISLSSYTLEQADTLLIRVESEEKIDNISGEFGSEKINFFKSITKDWIAIVGIDAKKKPGNYNLDIGFNNEKFKEEIKVVKRDFPVTELLVTKELEEKGYTPSKISENIAKEDNPSIGEILKIFSPAAYFNQPFIHPLKKIKVVGNYGNIRKSGEVSLQHLGVDLDAENDTLVYAVNDGIVSFSEDLINYGKTLIIDHGFGTFSLYLHLNKFNVLKGEEVKQGDIIGFSGNTGYSITPHLHFSIKVNGSSVDPLRFIKTTREKW